MTECKRCHMDLSKVEEVHAVQGDLFCSKDCAIAHIEVTIVRSAHKRACDIYNNCAETVLPSDIGLTQEV